MSPRPGTIEVCEECEAHINGALCPDDCEIYQDLQAEYHADLEHDRRRDNRMEESLNE